MLTGSPVDQPLPARFRPCRQIDPASERTLLRDLVNRGLATLLLEEVIPRDSCGALLRGALFCLPHTPAKDQLMNNR